MARPEQREPLTIGLVSVYRPLFKGDSHAAATRSAEQLRTIGAASGFEVITPTAVTDPASARAAAAELREAAPGFLLIQHTTFATGDLLAPLLSAVPRVGVWALPESAGRPGERSGPLPLNALCGLTMTMSLLDHPQVGKKEPVKWFYGEATSALFGTRLHTTLAALRGLRALSGARILHIGGTAPGFYGLEEQPHLAGVTVETKGLQEVFARVAAISDEVASSRAAEWQRRETVDVSADHLERAARVELALLDIAKEGDYHALALRCWPEFPDTCGVMACASVARLGDANLPTACEGDVMGALSMLVLQGVSGRPALLMDLSDIDLEDDALLFWHCGNAPVSWAATPGSRLTTHFNRDTLGVVRDMTLRAGPASGFRLLAGGRRAVVMGGQFVGPSRVGFDGVRGWLKELRWDDTAVGASGLVSSLLEHRLPHHLAFGEGDLREALTETCHWLGARVLPYTPPRAALGVTP